jgi:integrase
MPKLHMDDRTIAGLRGKARVTYFDTFTRGLALRAGAELRWYWTYRHGGPTEWFGLGSYPALSLKEARAAVNKRRRALEEHGIDPAAARRKALEPAPEPPPAPAATAPIETFGDFAPVFVAFQKGRGNKAWTNDQSKITRHILPAWRDRPLRSITRQDVQALLDAVAAKGLTVGVNRIQALVSRIFTVALDRGLVDAHPAARIIKRFQETPRERVLSDTEIRALWAALEARQGEPAADAIALRLLLGQRGEETAGMRWAELDLEECAWSLPRPRTKNKQPHVIGFGPRTLAILNRRRELVAKSEPRVFPGFSLQRREHQALGAIHGGAYTWKDLRRTMSTALGDLGFDDSFIDRVLNHKKTTITGKHYNHARYLEEIREALLLWEKELERILRGEPKARVLRMRNTRAAS